MSTSATLPKLADIPSPDPSSSTNRRPSHIESYGVHCQEPTCNLGDFLPFKCGYCKLSYCSYHRLPFSHECKSYDEKQLDNRASLCQWCEEPLRVENLPNGKNTDINIVMEYHILNGDCKVLKDVGNDGLFKDSRNGSSIKGSGKLATTTTASGKKKDEKKCTFGKCKNIMWVEIKCPYCGEKFCPSHRERKSHKCGEDKNNNNNNNSSSSSSINNDRSPSIPQQQQQQANKSPNFMSAPFMKAKVSSSVGSTSSDPSTNNTSTQKKAPSPLVPQNPFSKLSLSTSKNGTSSSSSKSPQTTASTSTNVIDVIKGKTSSSVNDMSTSRRAAREREQAAMALKNRAKKG